MVLNPATYTQAINKVLRAMGKEAILSYPSANQSLDEKAANDELEWATREYQILHDWKFNYEEKITFTAQPSGVHQGHIILHQINTAGTGANPANDSIARVVLHVSNAPVPGSPSRPDVVDRMDVVTDPLNPQRKLYDLVNHTYNFGVGASRIVNITYLRDWRECPPAYQEFATWDAVVNVLSGRTGSEGKLRSAESRRRVAWAILTRDQSARGGTRFTESAKPYRTALDNADVAKPLLGVNMPRLGGMA